MTPSPRTGASARGPLAPVAALADGWRAFRLAPWSFLGFELLMLAPQLLLQPLLAGVGGGLQGQAVSSADWMLFLLGAASSLVLDCFATVAMVRASWRALAGERPSLGEMLRWEGAGLRRLLEARLSLALVLALPLLTLLALALAGQGIAGLVESTLPARSQAILGLPSLLLRTLAVLLLAGWLVMLPYLLITQQFQGPIAVLEERGPLATLKRGQALVEPQFLPVVLLILLKMVLALLGLLSFAVGLLLTTPLIVCLTTAAYRQLAGPPAAKAPTPASPY